MALISSKLLVLVLAAIVSRCRADGQTNYVEKVASDQMQRKLFGERIRGAERGGIGSVHNLGTREISAMRTTAPTRTPTPSPTNVPTTQLTGSPTDMPTVAPTANPTSKETESPTLRLRDPPPNISTEPPTQSNTDSPTAFDSESPTHPETESPTELASHSPTAIPSDRPTESPSTTPTEYPSTTPTEYPSSTPTESPSANPTDHPSDSPTVAAFVMGRLNKRENGLVLSEGLSSRIIASSAESVLYDSGELSEAKFHRRPSAGDTFEDTRGGNPGGWIYLSGEDVPAEDGGGIGAITFNADGEVIDYTKILDGSGNNNNGGRTPWNTYVSGERDGAALKGDALQVDPLGVREAEVISMTEDGAAWKGESSFPLVTTVALADQFILPFWYIQSRLRV